MHGHYQLIGGGCSCGVNHASGVYKGALSIQAGGEAQQPATFPGSETIQSLVFVEKGKLEWRERPRPQIVGPEQAVVRPIASSTCDLDHLILAGRTPFSGPFAICHECVAEVMEIGEDVKTVAVGDIVTVPYHMNCGTCDRCIRGLTASCRRYPQHPHYGLPLTGDWGGLMDDLVHVPFADGMLLKLPDGVDPIAAASVSDNTSLGWETTAQHLAECPGGRVLVLGGTNSIGLYVVDFAQALGAGEVFYCDSSDRRLAIAEKLGVKTVRGMPDKTLGTFDITIDASVDPRGLRKAIKMLEPEGFCESVGIYFQDVPFPMLAMYWQGVRFRIGRGNPRLAAPYVLEAIAQKKVQTELVHSGVYAFADAVDAYVATEKPVFYREPLGKAA
jgi:threonine dehydrogenase-like Zn-dependent dehydrogenase